MHNLLGINIIIFPYVVGGSPPPEIVWYKNGEPGQFTELYVAGSKTEPTTSYLTLEPAKEDDGAQYR